MPDNEKMPQNEVHKTTLQRILDATNSLMNEIEDTAVDLAIDDMSFQSEESVTPMKKNALLAFNPRFKTLHVFIAGLGIGVACSFGAFYLSSNDSDSTTTATTNLIQERILEKQTLTPLATLNLPFANVQENSLLPLSLESKVTLEEPVLEEVEEEHPPVADILNTHKLRRNQNLSTVLKKEGLTNAEIHLVSEALSDVFNLKHLQIGDIIEVGKMKTEEGKPTLFSVSIENKRGFKYIASKFDTDVFEANMIEPEVDVKTEYAQGDIDGIFLLDAKSVGIPNSVVHQIIWAFDGPIDFSRDLRKGDSYTAVFEKEYDKSGDPTGYGNLLYAEITLRNKKHERYLYKDSKDQIDYYDEKGKIARKLLTMHPLKRQRITSPYGQRKHPILGYKFMHWGIDYGAPKGTPIRAPGDGTIVKSGRNGAYGLYIKMKHNSEYSTAYGHLSKIKYSRGKKVKAGQIIGYVGSTGRSTGPHLHWELIKNGRKINPRTQRITAQRKLSGEELKRFYAERNKIRENVTGEIAYARAEPLNGKKSHTQQAKKTVEKKYKKTASRKAKQTKG